MELSAARKKCPTASLENSVICNYAAQASIRVLSGVSEWVIRETATDSIKQKPAESTWQKPTGKRYARGRPMNLFALRWKIRGNRVKRLDLLYTSAAAQVTRSLSDSKSASKQLWAASVWAAK